MKAIQINSASGRLLRNAITIVVTLCTVMPSYAYHTWGGTMSYEAIEVTDSFTRFKLRMQIARGFGPGPEGANFDSPAEIAIWRVTGDEFEFVEVLYVALDVIEEVDYPSYELHIGDEFYVVQVAHYETVIKLPNDGYDYLIGYRRCCRIANLSNIHDADSANPTQPGAAYGIMITNGAIEMGNSSPAGDIKYDYLINLRDTVFERNMSFADGDGDVLVYSFSPPRIDAGVAGAGPNTGDGRACNGIRPDPEKCPPLFDDADYFNGYSSSYPFGSDVNVSLDSVTGLLKGSKLREGLYTVGLTISEYREGELISATFLDYTFFAAEIDLISKVSGYRFFDINRNGEWDNDEPTINHLTMNVLPSPLKTKYFSSGAYSIFLTGGDYSVSTNDTIFEIPDDVKISVDSIGETVNQDIPYVALSEVVRSVPGIRILGARCDRKARLDISVFNSGTFVQSGIVTIRLDSITTFEYSDIPDLIVIGEHELQYSYDSLQLLSTIANRITISIPGEEFIGDTMLFELNLSYHSVYDPDVSGSAEASVRNILSCSLDPNAKFTFPTRDQQNTTYPGERISYTIAFQNHGNDTAYHIQVIDNLSSYLDEQSLTFNGASHEYYCEKIGRRLTFYFNNINLPPASRDSVGSTGYISISANPRYDVKMGTRIDNKALIYFDQNSPFSTNTVLNTMGLPPTDESSPDLEINGQILVFPNPSADFFQFALKEDLDERSEIFVFDVSGRLVLNLPVQGKYFFINLDSLPGIYYYLIINSDGSDLYSGSLAVIDY
jgi:uncharacterized repeat protein (TIGR01451 family)